MDRAGGCTRILGTLITHPSLKEEDWPRLSSEKLGTQPYPLIPRASANGSGSYDYVQGLTSDSVDEIRIFLQVDSLVSSRRGFGGVLTQKSVSFRNHVLTES